MAVEPITTERPIGGRLTVLSVTTLGVGGANILTIPRRTSDAENQIIIVKDETGGATASPITIQGEGGTLIDGAASLDISDDYGVVTLYTTGPGGDMFTGAISGSAPLGPVIIDATSAEAFLVRRAGDTGDIFVVDTLNQNVGFNVWTNIANNDILEIIPTNGVGAGQTMARFDPSGNALITSTAGSVEIQASAGNQLFFRANATDELDFRQSAAGVVALRSSTAGNTLDIEAIDAAGPTTQLMLRLDPDNLVTAGVSTPAGVNITSPGAGAASEKFGASAVAGGGGSVVIGNGATDNANGAATIVGRSATVTGASVNSSVYGNGATATLGSSTAIGQASTASGAQSTALGQGSSATNTNSTALGQNSSSTAAGATAVGRASSAAGDRSVALGDSASVAATLTGGIAIGDAAAVTTTAGNIAIGDGAASSGTTGSIAIGMSTTVAAGDGAVAMGFSAEASGDTSVSIGPSATIPGTGDRSTAVGASAFASLTDGIAVGHTARVTTSSGTSVGAQAECNGGLNVSVGFNATSDGVNSICIGVNSADGGGIDNVIIGQAAVTTGGGPNNVVIGDAANTTLVTSTNNVVIGHTASCVEDESVVIGQGASGGAGSGDAVIIGASASNGALGQIVIGANASGAGAHTSAIVFGHNANSAGANFVTFGDTAGNEFISDMRMNTGQRAQGWERRTNDQDAVGIVAGGTFTLSNFIPAGSKVIGIVLRVSVAFGTTNGLTSFDIGDGTDVDLFGAAIGITGGTTVDLTDLTAQPGAAGTPGYYTTATDLVLTGNGGTGFDNTGQFRVQLIYETLRAHTS